MFWKKVLFVCILFCLAQGKPLYKSLNLSHEDYKYILSAHNNLRSQLEGYFKSNKRSNVDKNYLYQAAKQFKTRLIYIQNKYLSNVNNVIFGNDNSVSGSDNVIRGDNMQVYGDGSYVFHDRFSDIPISGGKIVRIAKYDVDLNKVELIQQDPSLAVRVLK